MLGTFSEDEVKKICADLDKSKAVVFFFPFFFRLMLDMEGNGCNLLVTKHVLASRKRWGPAFRTERCLMPSLQPGHLESSGKKRCPLVFPPWKPTLRINDQDNLMWYIFLAPDSPDLDFSLFLIYEFNSSPNFAFRVEEASLKKNTFVK